MYTHTHIFLTWLMHQADDLYLQRCLSCHVLPLVHKSAALMLMSTNFCHNNSFVSFYFTAFHFSSLKELLKTSIYLYIVSFIYSLHHLHYITYSAKRLVRKSSRSWSGKVQLQKQNEVFLLYKEIPPLQIPFHFEMKQVSKFHVK